MLPIPDFILRRRRTWVLIAVLACIVACVGDLLVPELLALYYPGYDPVHQSESDLGASHSPVAFWFTAWSICLALGLKLFALGVTLAFWPERRTLHLVSWLLILYGLGEGFGSGLFPYDEVNGELTWTAQVHEACSSVGSGALFLLPLAWLWNGPPDGPGLRVLSLVTLCAGTVWLLLFGASKLDLVSHRGLWQRLFIASYSVYLLVIARHLFIRRPPAHSRSLSSRTSRR